MSIRNKVFSFLQSRIGINNINSFVRFIHKNFPETTFSFEEENDEEFDGDIYFLAKDKYDNVLKYYPESNEWSLCIKDEEEYTGFEFEDIKKYYFSATMGNLLFFPTR